MNITSSCLIIGMGYLGQALAGMLRDQGITTTGWVRTEDSAEKLRAHGWPAIAGDAASPDVWKQAMDSGAVPAQPDWLVYCAAAGHGKPEAYRTVYVEGLRQALAHVKPRRGIFFVSATSVYSQSNGEWIDESSPAEPATEGGRIMLEAEKLALAQNGTVLRAVGIYGPARGYLWQQLLAGEAKIPGDGARWLNYIHRDDLAGAIAHLMQQPASIRAGKIFHVTDDLPVTMQEYYESCAAIAGVPVPPFADPPDQRVRSDINKRVSNTALRATGWQLRYPTFREGLSALWKEAQALAAH
jgi:nucleoside-diphosphate-sugar epimerase